MWLAKFLDLISRFLPNNPTTGIEEALADLDPDKIYVENVRSVLNVSYDTALAICERAVRQGFFKRGVEVKCPDGAVATTAETEEGLPATVICLVEEDGHYEEIEFQTQELEKRSFYKLNEEATTVLYGQAA